MRSLTFFLLAIHWLGSKSIGILIFLAIVFGGALISWLLLRFVRGVYGIFRCSEAICPTRNGARYYCSAVLYIVLSVLDGILVFVAGQFPWRDVWFLVYSIVFLAVSSGAPWKKL